MYVSWQQMTNNCDLWGNPCYTDLYSHYVLHGSLLFFSSSLPVFIIIYYAQYSTWTESLNKYYSIFILYYFTNHTFAGFGNSCAAWVVVIQSYDDDDNIPQAETLHTIHKVSFLVLENRFRLDWAVTFPSTVEGKGSDTDFFNIYGLFDATQGQSWCSSYTS